MDYSEIFKMPKPVNIKARTSSITNSFVSGIIPCIQPSDDEIQAVLKILGMDKDTTYCAYCGDKHTEWDHFRPLVIGKRPTGYISEINNLVPSCGKCNQSKGNKNWKEWILSDAKLSPKHRNIANLDTRIHYLEEFERHTKPIKLNIESIIGSDMWDQHWANCASIHKLMSDSQELSNHIRDKLKEYVDVTQN